MQNDDSSDAGKPFDLTKMAVDAFEEAFLKKEAIRRAAAAHQRVMLIDKRSILFLTISFAETRRDSRILC